ncbi:golgin subfamily A member 1-like isoform X2 [Portunus trituberculatus]|uniref:golgin subfamily A member 1-like isoform X2 n=1 Tax=Portunus trituberculatus TaxID=210409 RepID=UPI001E1CC4D1|nr:golgin subfamily A member 1-like isoform X2 [Portunus trituberculatus]
MFSNLKSKIGDVDLKRLSSPTTLTGSRQRSRQQTPGSVTPTPSTSHSRQPSVVSLPGLVSASPPLSPTTTTADQERPGLEKEQELEHEISKLRLALEAQQDSALDRLNAKEREWRARLEEERERAAGMAKELQEVLEREKKMKEQLEASEGNKMSVAAQLKQAQGLEVRVCEMQDNYDQLEGLNAQEGAKVKHMLLNANSELDHLKEELRQKTEALAATEARLGRLHGLEERVGALSEEKTELETQVAGLGQKLRAAEARCRAVEESKEEEVRHLEGRVATLEHRHSQSGLQETDRVQALIKEREGVEHSLEETRQQLNNIKASWSTKITSLEEQIHHLNAKIAEDQTDLQAAEERTTTLTSTIHSLKAEVKGLQEAKAEAERRLVGEVERLEEDVETLRWQLGQKEAREKELAGRLSAEEEKCRSCTGVLQAKIETIASLEITVTELEGKLAETETSLTTTCEELQKAQAEKKRLQESIARERGATEAAEKGRAEVEARLEVVSGEKERLSRNLDEYAERVETLEKSDVEREKEQREGVERLAELEARLEEVNREAQGLREQLDASEADLVNKIEESEVVKTLRENVKAMEEELTESKQNLKIQRQRLADMKKTLQRELRLTPDTSDSTAPPPPPPQAAPPPPLATSSAAIIDTSASYQPETQQQQQWEARMAAGNGPTSATNGNDNYCTINLAYLKHVIIKYLTSREYEAVHLTRAVATLLHMNPEEERLLRETLEWKMSWFGSKPNLGKGQGALTIPPSQ